MGSLTQPSDNFEDFFFTINGFDIEQNGKNVAKATYGFYKYLHVDGKFNPNAEVKVTHNVENGTDLFFHRELVERQEVLQEISTNT